VRLNLAEIILVATIAASQMCLARAKNSLPRKVQTPATATASMVRVLSPHETIGSRGKNQLPLPNGAPVNLVGDFDYPFDAAVAKKEGISRYRLTLSRWGSVSDCKIIESSQRADLDEATCYYASTRQNFFPATDDKGMPTSGTFDGKIDWRLPAWAKITEAEALATLEAATNVLNSEKLGLPPSSSVSVPKPNKPPESGTVSARFLVAKDGMIRDCVETKTGGFERDTLMRSLCEKAGASSPYTDDKGAPIERRVRIVISIEVGVPGAQ
jgi:Gram-negative bacterial TonB protein C-terminal